MAETDFILDKMRVCGDPIEAERQRIKKELFRIYRSHRGDRLLNETCLIAEQILCEVMEALYGADLSGQLVRPTNVPEKLSRMEWVKE